jgi:hypothetical protein
MWVHRGLRLTKKKGAFWPLSMLDCQTASPLVVNSARRTCPGSATSDRNERWRLRSHASKAGFVPLYPPYNGAACPSGRAEGRSPSAFLLKSPFPKGGFRGIGLDSCGSRNDRVGGFRSGPFAPQPGYAATTERVSRGPTCVPSVYSGASRGAQPLCVLLKSPFPKGGLRGIGLDSCGSRNRPY